MHNSKTIDHFLPDSHFYFAVSFSYFDDFNTQPFAEKVFFYQMIYYTFCNLVFIHTIFKILAQQVSNI